MQSNPVHSNQINGLNLDFKCLLDCDCSSCKSLNDVFQLLIDKACKNDVKLEELTYSCFSEPDTLQQLIQELINRVDCNTEPLGVDPSPGTSLPPDTFIGLDLCNGDNWACSINTPSECIQIRNDLGVPVNNPTIRDVIQSIFKRLMSQQREIKRLCDENTQLKSRISLLESEVGQIKENCCNTTLLNKITFLESAIIGIQQNCC